MAELNIVPNEEYELYAYRWQRVRDVVNGEARLKERDLNNLMGEGYNAYSSSYINKVKAIRYLRPINPSDNSRYNRERNANYINGARLYDASSRTLSGLIGMLYRVAPVKPELPKKLEYLLENIDGSGIDIDQQSQSVATDVLQIGRDGLLADMPRNEDGTEITAADVANGFRATIQEYKAESIIDWHESIINGSKKLDLLVLRECVERFIDSSMLNREMVNQYKVYRLTGDGVTIQVYTDQDDGIALSDEIAVLGAGNARLTEIPFSFVGSTNNKPCIDQLPLEGIVNVNLGHYQESANLASSSFNLSAAQPWVADDNYQRQAKNAQGDDAKVGLGEESLLVLGTGGSFNVTAPPENSLASGLKTDYENQMVALGAQLITSGSGNETAEAAKIRHASDVSELDIIAGNISDAYSKCFEWVGAFMGVDLSDVRYELNRDFFASSLTAQEIDALVRTWQAGAISKSVLDANFVSNKVIPQDVDLDEMNNDIDAESDMVDLDEPTTPPEEEING